MATQRPTMALSVLFHAYKTTPQALQILKSILKVAQSCEQLDRFETIPVVSGKPLDIVRLFHEVLRRGGEEAVTSNRLWSVIAAKDCMQLDTQSFELHEMYIKYLRAYETAANRNRKEFSASSVTNTELQQALPMQLTPIPLGSRRLKMHVQRLADVTSVQRLVLALDSNIKKQVSWALNQFTILSYPGGRGEHDVLLIEIVPAVLDALQRQFECNFFPAAWQKAGRTQSFLLNYGPEDGERHILEGKVLILLNIVRNLSFTSRNQFYIGSHAGIMKMILDISFAEQNEFRHHALDIISSVAKYVGRDPENGDGSGNDFIKDHLILSKKMFRIAQDNIVLDDRNAVLRSCEIMAAVAQRKINATFMDLLPNKMIARFVELLFLQRSGPYSLEKNEEVISNTETIWPSPWADNSFAGASMGVVFGSKQNLQTSWAGDENLDHELRDASLEALYRISDCTPALKYRLAKDQYCLERLANVLISRVGKGEAGRIAVGTLSNISMHTAAIPLFLPIERTLVLVAASDENLSDILSNIIADVYGVHAIH